MTTRADQIETLVKQRIEQNHYERSDIPRLAGSRFRPLQLACNGLAIGRDYQRQKWSMGELMSYYDRQFVQNAYLVLLKRDADVEGLTGRLKKLRSGELSRIELLFRLRYGPEGKQHGTRIQGLLPAFAIERVGRIPVIGVIPRYLRALLYLSRMQGEIEHLQGLIAMQKNEADDSSKAMVDFQNEHFTNIIRHLNR